MKVYAGEMRANQIHDMQQKMVQQGYDFGLKLVKKETLRDIAGDVADIGISEQFSTHELSREIIEVDISDMRKFLQVKAEIEQTGYKFKPLITMRLKGPIIQEIDV